MDKKIEKFFISPAYGVVGASSNKNKYGNKVLRCYIQHNKKVYPVNPSEITIEDINCYQSIYDLPKDVGSISIITPPAITKKIVEQAIQSGIENIWMQPGAESDEAIHICIKHNINLIAGGPCILVQLGFIDE